MIKLIKKVLRGEEVIKKAEEQSKKSKDAIRAMKASLDGEENWFMCVRRCMDECQEDNK